MNQTLESWKKFSTSVILTSAFSTQGIHGTAQEIKFFIKGFFSKCDQT